MRAEIISIGTELLMGELVDTNAQFLADQLPSLGIQLKWITQIGDDREMLSEAFKNGLSRSDIIITSGGLGPTQDDLTRESISDALDETIYIDDAVYERLVLHFAQRGTEMPRTNIKQAFLIPSAVSIPNEWGTAPGWWVEKNGTTIISMPGPPHEMKEMWGNLIIQKLAAKLGTNIILTRTLKLSGLSEGALDELIADYLLGNNPYVGIYAKSDGIHLRIIARGPNKGQAQSLLASIEHKLISKIGAYIWGIDDDTPQSIVGNILRDRNMTIATVEHYTGGILANYITDIDRSDTFYKGSMIVSDSFSGWEASGIPVLKLKENRKSSPELAELMALQSRKQFVSDIGIGISAINSRYDSNINERSKLSGMVYVAIALPEDVHVFAERTLSRQSVSKHRTALNALIHLGKLLSQSYP